MGPLLLAGGPPPPLQAAGEDGAHWAAPRNGPSGAASRRLHVATEAGQRENVQKGGQAEEAEKEEATMGICLPRGMFQTVPLVFSAAQGDRRLFYSPLDAYH